VPEVLQRPEFPETAPAPRAQGALVPPVPPEGLDTVLFEHDDRASRADLRRQIAAMEAELGQLFASAFPRKGIDFRVSARAAGPRILSVDELERVRDSLASRLSEVRAELGERGRVEEQHRLLIEDMTADPKRHRWIRVSNEDIGEPGCRHWHSRPRWGPLGMLLGWWRVIVSSGCPLAGGLAAPSTTEPERMAKRKQKRRRRPAGTGPQPNPRAGTADAASEPTAPEGSAVAADDSARARARRGEGPPPPPWGSFPLSEIVVLIAIVLLAAGFFVAPPRGAVMLGAGLVLGSLAGLELSVREHFSGYRSHTLVLGGAVGVVVIAFLYVLAGVGPLVAAAGGTVAFAAAAFLFGRAFRRRSGGAAFRIRPFGG